MSATIFTVCFRDGYLFMFEAMRKSIAKNWPTGILECAYVPAPPEHRWLPRESADNTFKLRLWAKRVERAEIGENLILMDCDMLILGSMDEAFRSPFDVAYTVRNHRARINGGVVYVHVTELAKQFVKKWVEVDGAIYGKGADAYIDIVKGAGINQTSMAQTISKVSHWEPAPNIVELPCEIWNCEQVSYPLFSDATKVLHVKSWLREVLLHDAPADKASEAERSLIPLCRSYGY